MFATELALKQRVTEERRRDFLREAERERLAALAVATSPAQRRGTLVGPRAAAARALLRAGHRLMPAETPADRGALPGAAFELRLGQ